ncbi:hypothetical protein BpHYR1_025984 [Brachionus plicatilis]|uniref:Uncharacterized protein n=1 Tax=Brachionus plicatilis TaxID=10195 RepID=A0A3M7PZ56_BRAPC|nr:hypothetical protein BpHYR1_025984 [Brachionus plicatilis]
MNEKFRLSFQSVLQILKYTFCKHYSERNPFTDNICFNILNKNIDIIIGINKKKLYEFLSENIIFIAFVGRLNVDFNSVLLILQAFSYLKLNSLKKKIKNWLSPQNFMAVVRLFATIMFADNMFATLCSKSRTMFAKVELCSQEYVRNNYVRKKISNKIF